MASIVRVHIAFFFVAFFGLVLLGCNGGTNGTSGTSTGASATPNAATKTGPTISGTPATSVVAGSSYNFRPTVTAPAGDVLTYAVKNLPAWATFDAATGTISGRPTAANVGSSGQILITVSDGGTTATLAPFSIGVTQAATNAATISWTAPDANIVGATNVAGYHIYYGTNSDTLTHVVDVNNAGSTSFVINNLTPGVWYFAVADYSSSKLESSLSAIVAATI